MVSLGNTGLDPKQHINLYLSLYFSHSPFSALTSSVMMSEPLEPDCSGLILMSCDFQLVTELPSAFHLLDGGT